MWISLACLLIHDSWSVAISENYILIPSDSLTVILFDVITGAIVVVAYFTRCVFAPDYDITSMLLLGGLGGVSIIFLY